MNAFARYVTFLCGLASKSFILYPCRVDAEEGDGEGEQGSTGKGKGAMGKRVNEERPGRCRNSGIMQTLVVLKQAHHPGKSLSRRLPLGLGLSCLFSRALAFLSAACGFISPPYSLGPQGRHFCTKFAHAFSDLASPLQKMDIRCPGCLCHTQAPATCITLLPHTVYAPYWDTLGILA